MIQIKYHTRPPYNWTSDFKASTYFFSVPYWMTKKKKNVHVSLTNNNIDRFLLCLKLWATENNVFACRTMPHTEHWHLVHLFVTAYWKNLEMSNDIKTPYGAHNAKNTTNKLSELFREQVISKNLSSHQWSTLVINGIAPATLQTRVCKVRSFFRHSTSISYQFWLDQWFPINRDPNQGHIRLEVRSQKQLHYTLIQNFNFSFLLNILEHDIFQLWKLWAIFHTRCW